MRAELEFPTSGDRDPPVHNGLLNPSAQEGTRGDNHGYRGPPAAIPRRAERVDDLISQALRPDVSDVRRPPWPSLATTIRETDSLSLLPQPLGRIVKGVCDYQD